MNGLDKLLKYDASKIRVKHSKIADIWGMNLSINGTFLLTKLAWNRYLKRDRKPNGLLFHEYVHYCQQQKLGFLKFAFLYLFCFPIIKSPYRKEFEFEAYRITLAWQLKSSGYISPAYKERLAKILSSWKYGWMTTYKEVSEWIDKTCKELKQLKKSF